VANIAIGMLILILTLGVLTSGVLCSAYANTEPSKTGTSVWGEEAREVYNAFITLGATRVDIPEGPTIIVDRVDCVHKEASAGVFTAQCKFQGDPKLNMAEGAMALRLVNGLVTMGIKKKTTDGKTALIAVTALNCGILHNVPGLDLPALAEVASCFFVDSNQ
jgi:hypothetical protein